MTPANERDRLVYHCNSVVIRSAVLHSPPESIPQCIILEFPGKRERQVSIDVFMMLIGRSIEHTRAPPTMHYLEFQNSVEDYLFKFQNCTVRMLSTCPLRIYIHFYAIAIFRVS